MKTKPIEKITVRRLAPGRFLGVAEASRRLKVSRQTLYIYLGGRSAALGKKNRDRIVVVDSSTGEL